MEQNQDPRWLRLRPSRIHLALAVAGGTGACLIALLLPAPAWARMALLVALILLTVREVRRARLLGGQPVLAFYLIDAEPLAAAPNPGSGPAIRLRLATASEQEGIVLSGAYITPWFSSLPYCLADDPPWRRRWPRLLALWPDSLDADEFRRVRVRLKWG